MQTGRTIRKRCIDWATKTYRDELLSTKNLSEEIRNYSIHLFESLNIADIAMNGNSCEGLPKTDEQRVLLRRTYSDIFHSESEKDNFSPTSYLIEIVKECLNANIPEAKTIGTLARGLRTFTSLLREPDFAEQISAVLISQDKNVNASLNAKQDSTDHTDVLLTFKGKQFRIWLYQFSSRGLPHDIERLSGKRGKLPNGIHVTCPLKTELAMDLTKYTKSLNTNMQKLTKVESDLQVCSEKAIKRRLTLENSLNNTKEKISELNMKIKNILDTVANELDVVEGWFFYSRPHVERIANAITNNVHPQDYKNVYAMLTAPEKFVGTVNIFNKENDYE